MLFSKISNSYSTGPGIYGSKRTESEGEARGQGLFTAINPWQPVLYLLLYDPPDWSEFRILGDTIFKFSIATIATVLFFHSTVATCSYDPYCLGLCEWTDCPGALQLEDTPRPTYPLVSAPPPHSPPATASSSSHSSLCVQPESTRF